MNRVPVFSQDDLEGVDASALASLTHAFRREVSGTSAKQRRRMELEREKFRQALARGNAMGMRSHSEEE